MEIEKNYLIKKIKKILQSFKPLWHDFTNFYEKKKKTLLSK